MQAARGASLNSSADAHPDLEGSPSGAASFRLLFGAVFLVAYVLDVGSKILAVETLTGRPDVELVGEWFQLHLIRNPGAAFSAGSDFTPALSVLAIVACCVVLFLARRIGARWWAVSLGLLLAGIGGNLTDRLLRAPGPLQGHVIDFFQLPNWPIFNVADICIDVGAGLALLLTFRGVGLDGTREEQRPRDGGAVPGDPAK